MRPYPQPGTAFGRYDIGRLLGRGGMGVVHAAVHRDLERDVAVKFLSPDLSDDDAYRNRFLREAKTLARLDSPHVVRVFDAGEQDGWLFIVTELVPDGDLQEHLDAHGPLAPAAAMDLFRQVCVGVEAGHDAGVLHRDIKPSNVLVKRQPDGRLRAIVCDFGIAAVADTGATLTHGVIGTWRYLAPERHEGRTATVATDVYALGCLLWAMVTGRPPYVGTPAQQAIGHLRDPVPMLPPGHPAAGLGPLLTAMMAKDPAARPTGSLVSLATPSAEPGERRSERPADRRGLPGTAPLDLPHEAVTRPGWPGAGGSTPVHPPPPPPPPLRPPLTEEREPRSSRRTRTLVVGAVLAVVVVVLLPLLAWVYLGPDEPDPGSSGAADSRGATGASEASTTPAEASTTPTSTPTTNPLPTSVSDHPCATSSRSGSDLKVGGLMPVTGNLAFLGPPAIAGVGLAVSDVNAAGGVGDSPACYEIEDSGDATDLSTSTASARKLVAGSPSLVVGPSSSSVTENVLSRFAEAGIVQISPANTANGLSGIAPTYFRTIVPDTGQGDALGSLLLEDGRQRVSFLVFADAYGTDLRDVTQATFVAGGGSCAYGCQGDGDEFAPFAENVRSQVSAALAARPDAVVVIAFSETTSVVDELRRQGWDPSTGYFTDGNTASYATQLKRGSLTGAQGLIPGANASAELRARLDKFSSASGSVPLTEYSYAAEAYDAVVLAALAAVRGGATDPGTIQDNLIAVSGGTGGTTCTTYADCATLLEGGEEVTYSGQAGIGPLNSDHDPSSGPLSVYRWDAANNLTFGSTVVGTT